MESYLFKAADYATCQPPKTPTAAVVWHYSASAKSGASLSLSAAGFAAGLGQGNPCTSFMFSTLCSLRFILFSQVEAPLRERNLKSPDFINTAFSDSLHHSSPFLPPARMCYQVRSHILNDAFL
jgi:hypothetical protein